MEICPQSELAYIGILSCELAPQWKNSHSEYSVKKDPIFNSRRSDFSPVLVGDESDNLILSSTRSESKGDEENGITGSNYSDLFLAKKDEKGKWANFPYREYGWNTKYDNMLNDTGGVWGGQVISEHKGNNINGAKSVKNTTKTQTSSVTHTKGYDKEYV